jgi:hypothetical protein
LPWAIKWLGLIAILILLYLLIVFYADRFFGLRFRKLTPNDFDFKKNTEYVSKLSALLKANDSNWGLLLIGVPHSGKRKLADKLVKQASLGPYVHLSFLKSDNLDSKDELSHILKTLDVEKIKFTRRWGKIDVVILEGLEYNLTSYASNRIKLRVISHLISLKKKIILTSEVYPSQILDLYQNQIGTQTQTKKDQKNGFNDESNDDHYAWRDILGAFAQVIIGIEDNSKKLMGSLGKAANGNKRFLSQELGYGYFLPKMAEIHPRGKAELG